METKDAIKSRRSVKQYDPEHKMNDADLNKLLSLAALSPTASSIGVLLW